MLKNTAKTLVLCALAISAFVRCGGSVERTAEKVQSTPATDKFSISLLRHKDEHELLRTSNAENLSVRWIGDQDHFWLQELLDFKNQVLLLVFPASMDGEVITQVSYSLRKVTAENIEVGTEERFNARFDSESDCWFVVLDESLLKSAQYENSKETLILTADLQTPKGRSIKEVGLRFLLSPVLTIRPAVMESSLGLRECRENISRSEMAFETYFGVNDSISPLFLRVRDTHGIEAKFFFTLTHHPQLGRSAPEERVGYYQSVARLRLKTVEIIRDPEDRARSRVERFEVDSLGSVDVFIGSGESFALRPLWGPAPGQAQVSLPAEQVRYYEWMDGNHLTSGAKVDRWSFVGIRADRNDFTTIESVARDGEVFCKYSQLGDGTPWSVGTVPEDPRDFPQMGWF